MTARAHNRTRRASVLAASTTVLAAALAAAGAAAEPSAVADGALPRAEIFRLPDLDPALLEHAGDRKVRVGIVLTEQPVLEETTEPAFEAALSGYTRGDLQQAARENPHGVSDLEAEAARDAERRRNVIGRSLAAETAELEAEEASLERVVERVGGEPVESAQSGPLAMVTARVPRSELEDLAHRGDVQGVISQPKLEPELNTSTTTIGASSAFAQHSGGGDDGFGGASDVRTGIEVGMSSDPPNPSHPAFAGITVNNGGSSPGAHGTATAGVVASRDATYRGVAPGISALRGGAADDWSTTDVDVRSESFGNFANGNDGVANVADLAASTFLVPWAASGGNRNWDTICPPDFPPAGCANEEHPPGTSSTGGSAMGRNILSVGAFGDNSTTAGSDDLVAMFSSFGPSPGGRKEPELTAPGVAITTTSVGGGFGPESGTSLAAPHVGGALAILVGAGMTDPRAMRAVLVNSAQPWCNGHNHTPPSGTSLLTAYPSGTCQDRWLPDVGWGELDVPAALAQRGNAVVGDVEGGSARFYRATADPGEKATLAWNMRGVLGADVTQHVYYSVTNLNLRQYRSDETEILPASDPGWGAGPDAIDPNDATEQVRAPNPGGQVIYKVEAASTVEGAPTERFGLASANPLTALENPGVDPVAVAHSPSACDQNVHITAAGHNPSSDIEAATAQLTLELPAGVELVVGPQSQSVSAGILETDATSDPASWTVRPTTTGNHQVKIRGDGRAFGTTFTKRETITLASDCGQVDPGPGDPDPPPSTDTTVPQVNPHSLLVQPPGSPQCGVTRTLFAGFNNPTSRDAPDARGSLSVTGSGELLSAADRSLSDGVLEAGTSAPVQSWQLRESTETTTATVTGSTVYDGQLRASQARLNLSCRLTETSIDGAVRLRKQKVKVDGSLRFTGPREISIAGERVQILFERPDKTSAESVDERSGRRRSELVEQQVKLDRDGSFAASIGACRKGRYKVRAGFAGAPGYEPARRRTLETVRSDGC